MQIALKDKINRIYITSTDPVELERAYKEIMDGYLENAAIKQFTQDLPSSGWNGRRRRYNRRFP